MKMNSLISWVGGKKSIRDLIYARFPQSYGRYIEVFGGGGWVLFGKKPDKFEVYNDFNNNLSNMFAVVRDQPLAFIQELGYLPENGRNIFNLYKEIITKQRVEDFNIEGIRELTKPLFSIPTHTFLFNAGNTDARFYIDTLQLEESEYELIKYPQRGACLYKCGSERYNLIVHAPDYKSKLFGDKGGR